MTLKTLLLRFLALSLFSVLMPGLAGASLPDPTRPPTFLLAPGQGQGSAPLDQNAPPTVQAIKISSQHRSAVINGKEVRLGGRFDGAKVLQITPSEVVLRKNGKNQTLKLYPDVTKRIRSSSAVQQENVK